MNSEKDTQKTDLNLYGQSDLSNTKAILNKSFYDFSNKKTEKLVTALYMVTDCMDRDDALKAKLRLLGVELLSLTYKISTLSPLEKEAHITNTLACTYETISFIEIARTIGFISEMNAAILNKEFNILVEELKSYQIKDSHFSFNLNEKMFEVPVAPKIENSLFNKVDNSKGHIKDNKIGTMSFINKYQTNFNSVIKPKSDRTSADLEKIKIDRTNKILEIIKDKKEVSIKDISLAFTDCSEKTIQRELNNLVLKGTLKKVGDKRWSRYSLITN